MHAYTCTQLHMDTHTHRLILINLQGVCSIRTYGQAALSQSNHRKVGRLKLNLNPVHLKNIFNRLSPKVLRVGRSICTYNVVNKNSAEVPHQSGGLLASKVRLATAPRGRDRVCSERSRMAVDHTHCQPTGKRKTRSSPLHSGVHTHSKHCESNNHSKKKRSRKARIKLSHINPYGLIEGIGW